MEKKKELAPVNDPRKEMSIPNTPYTLEGLQRLVHLLVAAGYLESVRDIAQGCFKVLAGAELGIGPVASLRHVYSVRGRVGYEGVIIATRLRAVGYDYRVLESTEKKCRISFFKGKGDSKEHLGDWEYTIEEAAKADLLGKDTWKKTPKKMLFWRCLSNGAGVHCADAFGGNAPHTADELDDLDVTDGKFVAIPQTPQSLKAKLQAVVQEPEAAVEAAGQEPAIQPENKLNDSPDTAPEPQNGPQRRKGERRQGKPLPFASLTLQSEGADFCGWNIGDIVKAHGRAGLEQLVQDGAMYSAEELAAVEAALTALTE